MRRRRSASSVCVIGNWKRLSGPGIVIVKLNFRASIDI